MAEHRVTITDDDLRFVKLAVQHYRVFAEASERQGEKRTSGILRRQEFHAEMMLNRVQAQVEEKP